MSCPCIGTGLMIDDWHSLLLGQQRSDYMLITILYKSKMMQDSGLKESALQIITATVIGDARVGKTTLVHRACNLTLSKIVPTMGVQYASTTLKHKQRDFKIKFWDISGQRKYENLFYEYITKSELAIVVFDLNNYQSYHNAKEWIIDIRAKYEDVYLILFGNKKDLYDRNLNSTTSVPIQSIKSFVDETGVIYEQGCGLSDNKLIDAIKKMLERNFIPNEVILQGINEAKTCGCFC